MSFDPTSFMDATVTGANSTTMMPVPEGEYQAIIEKVDVKSWATKDGSASGLKAELVWEVLDDALKASLDRKKVTVRQSIMLDTTDTGALDLGKGKNVHLGRLREAVNQNDPKKPWAFSHLSGQLAKVSVKHRAATDGSDTIYDEVKAVARA